MFKRGFSKIKILIVVLLVFGAGPISASEFVLDTPPDELSYLFRLYYDNNQLFADRDFEFKYDVISEEFNQETLTTQFPFKAEVINFLSQVAETFQFDPRQGDPNFLKGKISVRAPYVPDGQKAVFYNAQGQPLLTVFVNESSFCNDDGVCDSERGEDDLTCSNDCKGQPSAVSQESTASGGGLSGMIWIPIALVLALGGAGGWYFWRRQKKSKNVLMPSSGLPTPPASVNSGNNL